MNRIDRRSFLRGAALLGGAAALRPVRAFAGLPPVLPAGDPGNIEHVVVMMMENRSFDHYFGWLTGTNRQTVVSGKDVDGVSIGESVDTYHLTADFRGCDRRDPDHGWNGGRAERDGGFLSADCGNDLFALGYYEESDVELYSKLARAFTLCDTYHCSLLGPTFPNREYMHSGDSGGLKTNLLPSQAGHPTGFPWPTIWDRLEAKGVSWGYYFVDLPAIGLWGSRLAKGARHIEHFYADAAAGTLPSVCFVDPGFTTGLRTDEHPHGDIRAGQAFVHNVIKAVVEAPTWPSTAMFLNYDEWGGFFDHVAPPRDGTDPRATNADPGGQEDFGQLGFRVPSVLISPYARRGMLSSQIAGSTAFEHTSILRFIERRWDLVPLPVRAANDIGVLLGDEPVSIDGAEIAELLPRVPVTSMACEGDLLSGVPGAPDLPLMHIDDDFQRAFESGWFEKQGYRLDLKPLSYALGG